MTGTDRSPARKKQRFNSSSAMDGPALTFSLLTKHQLHLEDGLSPGALHSNRVAIQALLSDDDRHYHAYIASGRRVMAVTAPRWRAVISGERGKGGAYLPEAGQGAELVVLHSVALRAEVQDVWLSESSAPGGSSVLACVDCYGRATLAHLRRTDRAANEGEDRADAAGGGNGSSGGGSARMQVIGVEQLQPEEVAVEAGWAGIALAPGQPSQSAIARHFPKDVTLFDGPLPVRTIHTLYRPNAAQLLSTALTSAAGGVLAVAEGPLLSIWDLRVAGRGARVAKLNGGVSSGHLYCIAASDGSGPPLLGAAGADRSVMVWDARKWASVDRWTNCLKYEATALHFPTQNANYCVACGLDYEVVCGRWGGERRNRLGGGHRTADGQNGGPAGGDAGDGDGGGGHCSFRGDSRWLGLARAQGQDVVAGLTASAQLYVAELGARGP